ncbi:hypothetical protein [Rhizobacter fulvus]
MTDVVWGSFGLSNAHFCPRAGNAPAPDHAEPSTEPALPSRSDIENGQFLHSLCEWLIERAVQIRLRRRRGLPQPAPVQDGQRLAKLTRNDVPAADLYPRKVLGSEGLALSVVDRVGMPDLDQQENLAVRVRDREVRDAPATAHH